MQVVEAIYGNACHGSLRKGVTVIDEGDDAPARSRPTRDCLCERLASPAGADDNEVQPAKRAR